MLSNRMYRGDNVPEDILCLLPASICHEHDLYAVDQIGDSIVIASLRPLENAIVDKVRFIRNCDVENVLVPLETIVALRRRYDQLD